MEFNGQFKNYSAPEDETQEPEAGGGRFGVGAPAVCQFSTPHNLRGHYPAIEVEILERKKVAGKHYFVVKPTDGTPIVGIAFVPDKKFKQVVNAQAELYAPRFEEFDPSLSPPSHRLTEQQALAKIRV